MEHESMHETAFVKARLNPGFPIDTSGNTRILDLGMFGSRTIKWICLFLGTMSLTITVRSAQSPSGGISGKVVTAKGIGLPAAVRVVRLGGAQQPTTVKSLADGTFSVTGLITGFYQICATPSVPGYVDSCLWRGTGPIKVPAGAAVTGQRVIIETAGTLQVQINDPAALLSIAAAPGAPPLSSAGVVVPHVMVGVITDRKVFVSVPVISASTTGRSHAVAVPVDRKVSLRLVAHGLTVGTSAAPNVNVSGTDIPVVVASGQSNPPVVFTVNGGGK
jgi:hypothetical protein